MMTFEVQTQRGKHHWITESHWDNSADALREANSLVGLCKFEGVKVIKSRLEPDNMFRETTIFRHQQADAAARRFSPLPKLAPAVESATLRADRRIGIIAVILCIGIATHAVLGVVLSTRPTPAPGPGPWDPRQDATAIYDLPAIATGLAGEDMPKRIRVSLRIEALESGDAQAIDATLPTIIDRLSEQLSDLRTSELRRR